jgi:quercetin dioxygenase-like cupin family protein
MTQQQTEQPKQYFTQHKEDEEMLRHREARLGEPVMTGDRWWPHESWKWTDLYEEGAKLTSYERWLAERELKRRENRQKMSSIIRPSDLVWEETRAPGVHVAYVVAPHMAQEAPSHTVEIWHLKPGAKTVRIRDYESVVHVLYGKKGHSTIYDERYDWETHDSVHVPEGAWFQHVNDSDEGAYLIIGRVTPLMEQMYTMSVIYKGDSFSDLPDDYKPEHPFTKERVAVGYVEGIKWMSELQMSHHHERHAHEKESRAHQKLLKGNEAVIQRSEHKGDWKVGLVDRFIGFDNKVMAMYVHQLPPSCHTETHKHGWATVFVLSGHGYSIVDGERHDWSAGDMINVPAGAWHQHFNTDPEQVSQHLLISPQGFRNALLLTTGSVEEATEALPAVPNGKAPTGRWWEGGD